MILYEYFPCFCVSTCTCFLYASCTLIAVTSDPQCEAPDPPAAMIAAHRAPRPHDGPQAQPSTDLWVWGASHPARAQNRRRRPIYLAGYGMPHALQSASFGLWPVSRCQDEREEAKARNPNVIAAV